jgi:KipI family sensor histidine kinase inhibitor
VNLRPASDRSLLISFGNEISIDAHRSVCSLTKALSDVRGLLNLHPAFASVLVEFDPRILTLAQVEEIVFERLETTADTPAAAARQIEIPVRFGGEAGPDLADVASHAGLSEGEAIEMFTAAEFVVYFLGFATAFPYLGGLPARLATPRLNAPRKTVPAGSIAIGGSQAGIYPLASPGGWRLIGRTPQKLFDPQATPPPLLRMGDRVGFHAL